MPPPVETPKSRRRDATEARDPRAARPAGRAGPARGRGVKQTARRTYRERRVFARPERAKHRAKLACASDWTGFEVFGSVSKTARLGAWAAVFGAGTRARCEFGQRPRSVSSRVAATGATRRRYRGRDRGNTDLRGSRGRRPRCSPCPFGSSRAVALRRGGVASVSRERAGENIKPCDTIAWWRARREARGKGRDGARDRARSRARRGSSSRSRGKARGAAHRSTRLGVTSRSPAPKSADSERRDAGGWHVHTGTTVVSSSSSPSSPFLRLRFFLNPGKDKISSAGVGTGVRPGERPRPGPAAYRLTPASSLSKHSRNSLTWLKACSTEFK